MSLNVFSKTKKYVVTFYILNQNNQIRLQKFKINDCKRQKLFFISVIIHLKNIFNFPYAEKTKIKKYIFWLFKF